MRRPMILTTVVGALLLAGAITAAPADARVTSRESPRDPARTIDRLSELPEERGISVMSRIDHGEGARAAGLELGPSVLVLFGDPKVGTPLMQDDPRAGLGLPMKMLAWRDDDGRTQLSWEDPATLAERFDIDPDHPVLGRIANALEGLADATIER